MNSSPLLNQKNLLVKSNQRYFESNLNEEINLSSKNNVDKYEDYEEDEDLGDPAIANNVTYII